ncbi:MAG: SDR family NAD(P)-dependent oxidoreductase, partial [Chloroflexota bacterium]|nr:SDR family NAD(P)-dependent oxidoreductase [Chloroflexota bacterium]
MGRLDGKVAIISGGSKGQGAVEAKLFVSEGAKVLFGDILDDEGQQIESEIAETGGEATYCHLDVTNESDWESVVRLAEEKYGRLDILVNNAGVSIRHDGMDLSGDEWDAVMNINAKGVFLGTKACIPAMQRSGGGSIVNISS